LTETLTLNIERKNFMLAFLEILIESLCGKSTPPVETKRDGQWVVDLPSREGIRLGPFRTRQDALDYRREYLIKQFAEVDPKELPF
jgi:hypothetical protein